MEFNEEIGMLKDEATKANSVLTIAFKYFRQFEKPDTFDDIKLTVNFYEFIKYVHLLSACSDTLYRLEDNLKDFVKRMSDDEQETA